MNNNIPTLAAALLVTISTLAAQSYTGTLNPTDPNDVFLVRFALSAPTTVRVQSFGYGGSASAPGGTNAAGTVIAPGGFDPYISLFSGTGINATFLASNDDGLCPPGTRVSGFCLDSTLSMNLPAGSYTLAFSVFENFSFAENLGVGTIGDLFINLGNYYDQYSNTLRTPRYAFDISGNGVSVIGTGHVIEPPTLSKAFGNPTILVNGSTALTFTVGNPGLVPLTGIAFNDPLPAGLVIDAPATTAACGGTLTSTATSISLANATLQPLTSCQLTVIVRGATPGLKNNLTSAINSIEGGAGLPATASVDVYMPPQITMQPSNQTVCAGSTATFMAAANGYPTPTVQWQVSIANAPFTNIPGATSTTLSLTTAAAMNGNRYQAVFSNVAGTATTNIVTLTVNTAPMITLSPVDQTVNEGQPVTFTAAASGQPTPTVQWQVSVNGGPFTDIPGATATTYTFIAAQALTKNRYRAVFTNTCGIATTDPAIFINIPVDVFQIRYASNLNQGDSVINISNTGVNGASLNGPGFGGAVGNLCVNAYAFSPDEQLISCCSCLLTPNALASLSVTGDMISNTLTGVRPNSVVIKLVATGAGADFTGTNCTNSAALAGTPNFPFAPGMVAYGTTIHPPAVTETPFLRGTLSLAELASINKRCTNIVGNGSTFGICRSCRVGGLNGAQ